MRYWLKLAKDSKPMDESGLVNLIDSLSKESPKRNVEKERGYLVFNDVANISEILNYINSRGYDIIETFITGRRIIGEVA